MIYSPSRIAWRGRDSNYDCTIRVSNLELKDAGKWVCEIGSSTKENFQVQTKEFLIDIESELSVKFGNYYDRSKLVRMAIGRKLTFHSRVFLVER